MNDYQWPALITWLALLLQVALAYNVGRARVRYQVLPRVWVAASAEYGSGLPFVPGAFTSTYQQAVAQYGQALVDRVDFAYGRVRPSLDIGASVGVELQRTITSRRASRPTLQT